MTELRNFTTARVDLGRAGSSLPTAPLLEMRLAHARARDAVHAPFDIAHLSAQMRERSWPYQILESAALNREEYLRRPDRGRQLADGTVGQLRHSSEKPVFVISGGLSAPAAERHALPLLDLIFALLEDQPSDESPVLLVNQARVAIGDQLGEQLQADLLVMLIGERPGLSSPDSLGVYLTWQPRLGRTDAQRNCVSNIHAAGLSYETAAHKIVFLMREMRRLRLSGIALKDTSRAYAEIGGPANDASTMV